ncbi:DUF6470 family protein [Aquibacillus sp. 3ASR75-11]|uniref:DUF6470 family protein n=1 Tax=Terrihalobacillus insolitus TaxID=2950438 RepID=A0A9X3WTJ7_9BACI|nr:DUF6470 family protein [Terrihalobacillus insolitus]MDC3412227.1 DUF6470 family protein [Terrihalobacillus insolitus]MDC3423079.1 DUF6470 family protein [Terrihalobacillus insolitus]
MKLPQIRIQTQMAKIQLNRTQGEQTIEQPKAIQSIQQPKAEMIIERTPSQLQIDQTEAWEDMDLKSVSKRIAEAAQLGQQDWLAGIARVSRQGDQLMKIENGGNPIASQAMENGFDPQKEFNIGWIPSAGSVKINYIPTEVKINVEPQKPIIKTQMQKPITNYQPGKVEVSLKQYPDVKIDFDNVKFQGTNFEITI